jgi:hypothetical protein
LAPVIAQQPASVTVPAGSSATFSVTLQDAAGVSYQWLRNGTAIAGATQSSYSLPAVAYADYGSRFAVRALNVGGLVTSAEATLTVNAPVGISMFVPYTLDEVLDLFIDAEGNTFAATRISFPNGGAGMIMRKYAPTGEQAPSGPEGLGLTLPGVAARNVVPGSFTGAVRAPSGDVFVSLAGFTSSGLNQFTIDSGAIYRVSPSGEMVALLSWPKDSVGVIVPMGIARSPDGTLYFLDYISRRLMSWTPQTGLTAGPVIPIQASIQSTRLVRLAVDNSNRVYVLDERTLRRVVGNEVTAIHTTERNTLGMGALTLDSSGNVYVAENTIIQKISPDGTVTRIAGQVGSTGVSTGALPGNLGRMLGPIAVGGDGVIQVVTVADGTQTYPTTILKIRLQ